MSLVVITGIRAAGKSTVAQPLAERLPRSVHLRGDVFRRMIVNGRVDMGPVNPGPEAVRQLQLRYELAIDVVDRYLAAGFSVVMQDIFLERTWLGLSTASAPAWWPSSCGHRELTSCGTETRKGADAWATWHTSLATRTWQIWTRFYEPVLHAWACGSKPRISVSSRSPTRSSRSSIPRPRFVTADYAPAVRATVSRAKARLSDQTAGESERQLQAVMGGDEAEAAIEAVDIGASLVGGQLHESAASTLCLSERPLEHCGSKSLAAVATMYPYRLDLSPQGAAASQTGDEGQLHGSHNLVRRGDAEQLGWVGIDPGESTSVGLQVGTGAGFLARLAQLVIG